MLLSLIVLVPCVMAEPETAKLSAMANGSIVHVVIGNVEDLAGFDITVQWSPSLTLESYVFHCPWVRYFIAIDKASDVSYRIVVVMLGMDGAFNGTTELVTFNFQGQGSVWFGKVQLCDSALPPKPIDFTVSGTLVQAVSHLWQALPV